MRGIVLAGGHGTRLHPVTLAVCKQLLPVYNKPMIYYPLSTLMLAGIRDILIISTPEALPVFRRMLRDGAQWGLHFSYTEQTQPRGLAEAFILGRDFAGGEAVCLILGDNIFYGQGLREPLRAGAELIEGALIFAYPVRDPERYGEKPCRPRSSYAVPGLYFCDREVFRIAASLKPSARGELEITDLIRGYLDRRKLRVKVLGRGVAWLDAGAHDSLLQAANFVQAVEDRQGMMISCPEEIAYRMGYIDAAQLRALAGAMSDNGYSEYLLRLLKEETGA